MDTCWCGNQKFSKYSSQYNKCVRCNTLVVKKDINGNPAEVHDDENDLYGKTYWEVKMVSKADKNSLDEVVDLYIGERCIYWLKHLFHYILPGEGSVAEVGCGLGQFAYCLKYAGYDQLAFELSPEICAYIYKTLGIAIENSELKDEGRMYKAVAAFDVLEHLRDPKGFLQTVSSVLEEDGILFFQTPCYDPKLTEEDMLREKPRFQEQMIENEHLFLFSRESVKKLLSLYGYEYVEFMPAFFGDDYDMFFAASRKPLKHYPDEEIRRALNQQPGGRLIRALISSWDKARDYERQISYQNEHLQNRLGQIEELTRMVHEAQKQVADRDRQIEGLTRMVHEAQKHLDSRESQIEELTRMVHEAQKHLDSRESQIEELTRMVREEQKH